jgi:hypothetical protein
MRGNFSRPLIYLRPQDLVAVPELLVVLGSTAGLLSQVSAEAAPVDRAAERLLVGQRTRQVHVPHSRNLDVA